MKKGVLKKHLLLCLLTGAFISAQAQQKIKDGTGTPVTTGKP